MKRAIKDWWYVRVEKLAHGIARRLPKKILYWAVVVAWARFTHKHPTVEAPAVTAQEIMKDLDNGQ